VRQAQLRANGRLLFQLVGTEDAAVHLDDGFDKPLALVGMRWPAPRV
jgi:hypothetical protein